MYCMPSRFASTTSVLRGAAVLRDDAVPIPFYARIKLYIVDHCRVEEKMPMKKYYCEYCDKQFQDTPLDRKRHSAGIQHKQAKARWYDSFKPEHHNPIPPPSNQPFCIHFVNTGFCRYGDSCKYFHPNTQQPITITPGNIVGDTMGVPFGNLPPSLQPPPEGGYSNLPFLDWG